jgi:xylan 1,4-beta-xylosidase
LDGLGTVQSYEEKGINMKINENIIQTTRNSSSEEHGERKVIENPILRGFSPDPSILRVQDDYYIATSTFEWFPAVKLFHSRDLVHWRQLGSILTDDTLVELTGLESACGIWAPHITYLHDTYILLFSIVHTNNPRYKDCRNFITTLTSPEGPWSAPRFLNCSGWDPSLFQDDDGRIWLCNMRLDPRPERDRFGGVVLQEIDLSTLELHGTVRKIFSGTANGKTEGPNLYLHNGWHYLVVAEGGTEYGHRVNVARSKHVLGPYEECPYNPIVRSASLDEGGLQRAGHASLVQSPDGGWFLAHLCSRPVDGFSILGRETALQKITWTSDGWPILCSESRPRPQSSFDAPYGQAHTWEALPARISLAEASHDPRLMTLRQGFQACGISFTQRPGWLRIMGGNSLASHYRQGLIALVQHTLNYQATVHMDFQPRSFLHSAGLVCYYNNENHYYACVSGGDGDDEGDDGLDKRYARVFCMDNGVLNATENIQLCDEGTIHLRALVEERTLCFQYSVDGRTFKPLHQGTLDMRQLSDEHVRGNGFTGATVGFCCQDLQGDGIHADFEWFEYLGSDANNPTS